MDQIASLRDRELYDQVIPTSEICATLLEPRAPIINSTKKKTFVYGPHARHDLDLYIPSSATTNSRDGGNRPLLVFLYGGGFASGDKIFDLIPGDLVYTNLGSFFADEIGYDTAVINYRLTKHGARFPRGAEDLDMALHWLDDFYAKQGQSTKDLYIMGNSAGGIHLTTWLFRHEYQDSLRRLVIGTKTLKLKAAITLSTPFIWPKVVLESKVGESVKGYYGDEQRVVENASLVLAQKALKDTSQDSVWPSVLTLVCEMDPDDIRNSGNEFMDLWKSKGLKGGYHVLEGHNHFSTVWTLRSGIKGFEQWGHDLKQWLEGLD